MYLYIALGISLLFNLFQHSRSAKRSQVFKHLFKGELRFHLTALEKLEILVLTERARANRAEALIVTYDQYLKKKKAPLTFEQIEKAAGQKVYSFDDLLAEEMKDPKFAKAYRAEKKKTNAAHKKSKTNK